MVYPALLPLMCTPRLPVVDWTDAPSRFKWTRPFRRKTKYGFCVCAITFKLASTTTAASNAGYPPRVFIFNFLVPQHVQGPNTAPLSAVIPQACPGTQHSPTMCRHTLSMSRDPTQPHYVPSYPKHVQGPNTAPLCAVVNEINAELTSHIQSAPRSKHCISVTTTQQCVLKLTPRGVRNLRRVRKTAESGYSFRHVCPSIRLSSWNNSAPTGRFSWILIFEDFFENLSWKFKFH